ncbi:MAG: XRE family transcriptional regulator [Comamonadaceae bacterium]|nr:MAG: XRE family transcriptional regulator [Comamonadaceae bacterium]
MALGYRIKALRCQQQITQEELADRCNMFRTYMSRIESGQANPTLTMLYEIAAAFGLDVRELFTIDDTPVAARVNSKGPRTSRGRVSR